MGLIHGGQVGNIITTRNAHRTEFEKILDNAKSYMRENSVNKDLQNRILRWYDYAWSKGSGRGGQDINSLGMLPDKLKTELALNVNLETLKKVIYFMELIRFHFFPFHYFIIILNGIQ
ncbi:unnamed protein product [Schistosoma margrebowiei]|uniref:Uncharacterized protein n=1 Tax=Schistosoma margrebowiei TaxID=48269 RepID=A0A183LT13_9TREM|nr:unnamed protein product [Schistosoma margrebowiei]